MAPICTNGPSLPILNPHATESVVEMQVTTRVVKLKTPGYSIPFMYAIVSGIPDPIAPGEM